MKQILVLKERWVLIGDAESGPSTTTLTNSSVIRVWGTTKGLGEIALKGPTPKTQLDPCGTVTVPNASILFKIDCK